MPKRYETRHDGDSHRVMDGTRGILYRGISSPPLLLIKLFGISRGRVTRQCRARARRKTRGEQDRCLVCTLGPKLLISVIFTTEVVDNRLVINRYRSSFMRARKII